MKLYIIDIIDYFYILTALALGPLVSTAQAFNYKVIPIRVETRSGSAIDCSSTLLRIGEGCHWLSNAHCIDYDPTQVTRIYDRVGLQTLSVSKVSIKQDLILLESKDQEWVQAQCKNLMSQPLNSLEQSLGHGLSPLLTPLDDQKLQLVGFVGSERILQQTPFFNYSTLTPKALADVQWIEASQIEMLPGQSGGVVISDRYAIGILSKFLSYQNKILFLPLKEIYGFIERPQSECENAVFTRQPFSAYQAGYFLKNGTLNGGNNSHAGGGSGGIDLRFQNNSLMEWLREPAEGITVGNRRVLAINRYQVDGTDDFEKLKALFPKGTELTSSPVGEITQKVKDQLIKRMGGQFNGLLVSKQDAVLHRHYFADHSSPTGWRLRTELPSLARLEVNAKSIVLDFGSHGDFIAAFPAKIVQFSIARSPNSDILLRDSENRTLACQNDSYSKLRCENETTYLSLSVNLPSGVQEHPLYPRKVFLRYADISTNEFHFYSGVLRP